jgi:antitoxin component of MazEF toxin-antitoxin module
MSGKVLTRKTDEKGRVTLPEGYKDCLVQIEIHEGELRIRKVPKARRRKYRLKDLLARLTPDNLHPEVGMGPPVGRELI